MRAASTPLLTAQSAGYPTGGVKPYVKCILTHKTGSPTYDYTYDGTLTTNRILTLNHRETLFDESATIVLRNEDLAVVDLSGYYVDLEYGANTSGGNESLECARLWVKECHEVERSMFSGAGAALLTVLKLTGQWNVAFEQPLAIGNPPYYQDDFGQLKGKTVYACIEYLIETTLSAMTDLTWLLDALTVDDGIINTLAPWPSDYEEIYMNPDAANGNYETIGDKIRDLISMTNCKLLAQPNLHFKVVYPLPSDAVNETYYTSMSDGHVFYEDTQVRFPMVPAQFIVFGNIQEDSYLRGDAYNDGDYDGLFNYVGTYMDSVRIVHAQSLTSESDLDAQARAYLAAAKANLFAGRSIISHDARVELMDKVSVVRTRGT